MSSLPSMLGESPSGAPLASLDSYIQPTLSHGLRIWWALYWRVNLLTVPLFYFAAAGISLLTRNDILSLRAGAMFTNASEYLIPFAVAFFLMGPVLRKEYRAFRISFPPAGSLDVAHELPLTSRRSSRIWWSYTWRSLIYVFIASFAASLPIGFVVMAATAVSPGFGRLANVLVGILLNGAVGLFVIYSNILDEDIGDVRVSLAPSRRSRPSAVATSPGT